MNGFGSLEDDISGLIEMISGGNFGRILSGFETPVGCPLSRWEIGGVGVFISEANDDFIDSTWVSFEVALIKMKELHVAAYRPEK